VDSQGGWGKQAFGFLISILALFFVFAGGVTPLLGSTALLIGVFVLYWGVAPELRA
jgi:hypothetical protein